MYVILGIFIGSLIATVVSCLLLQWVSGEGYEIILKWTTTLRSKLTKYLEIFLELFLAIFLPFLMIATAFSLLCIGEVNSVGMVIVILITSIVVYLLVKR